MTQDTYMLLTFCFKFMFASLIVWFITDRVIAHAIKIYFATKHASSFLADKIIEQLKTERKNDG